MNSETGFIPGDQSKQGRAKRSAIKLHGYLDTQLLNKFELAEALGRTDRTILRMVSRREIPPPVRLGGLAVWRVGCINAWISERIDRLESDAKREMKRLHF